MRTCGRVLLAGAVAAAGLVALGSAQAAESRPRQFITQYGCTEVQGIEDDIGKASRLTPDGRREVQIVSAKCAADAYNQQHPDQRRLVLVAPDKDAPATDNKTFLRAVALSDSQGVADFCAVAGDTVATDAGPKTCDAFVRDAKESLVVLVPSQVGGEAVTARILALVGSGDPDGHLAYAEKTATRATRKTAAKGSAGVAAQPVLTVANTGAGGTVSGTGGKFLQASRCLTTMGFASGCDRKDRQ